MEHGLKLMEQAFAAILFCVAVLSLGVQVNRYLDCLSKLERMDKNQNIYTQVEQHADTITDEDERISGGEVLAGLFAESMEYDVQIGERLITKARYSADQVAEDRLEQKKFRKEYVYDSNGTISRIIYREVP